MWNTENEHGAYRVIVTRDLPGSGWKSILVGGGCRVDTWVSTSPLSRSELEDAIGKRCDGVIGQLTESCDERFLATLAEAGGKVYSNFAVGYDNVDVGSATRLGIAVGNTPGVLTRTTAELAAGLTLAAARRLVEADSVVRSGQFSGWKPGLLMGTQLFGKTVGVVGAGRIGSAYARIMVRGFGMNLIYSGPNQKPALEAEIHRFASSEQSSDRQAPLVRFEPSLDNLLRTADVVSLHPPLSSETYHLLDAKRLRLMKSDAILVNVSRGPVVDEEALVAHCRENPGFRAGLDVFEDEPALKPGLADLPNVVLAPHIGSATTWTREGMAVLAARNVVGVLHGYPVWNERDYSPLLASKPPAATPSIVNLEVLPD